MRKNTVRIISLIIVIILVLGLFSSALAMLAHAAAVSLSDVPITRVDSDGSGTYTIEFYFTDTRISGLADYEITSLTSSSISADINNAEVTQPESTKRSIFKVTIRNATISWLENPLVLNYTATYQSYEVSGKATYRSSSNTGTTGSSIVKVITADTTVSKTLTFGKVSSGVTITFNFLDDEYLGFTVGDKITFDRLSMPDDSSFGWSKNTSLTIKSKTTSGSSGVDYYQATLSGVSYTGGSSRTLELTVDGDTTFVVPIPNKYFSESSSSGALTSDIVVQSTHVYDASGTQLPTVNKNTPPFSIEIIYYDVGLKDVGKSGLESASKYVFLTSAPGFKTLSGTRGTLEFMGINGGYPRFKAIFKNLTSDGTGTALGFRAQYDIEDYEAGIKGEATANLFQVITPDKDEENNEIAPLKPNIIIEEYSYGTEQIIAGSEFDLNLKFCNTSNDTAVENVVMTIEPNSGFIIASASNTAYFERMAPGESKPFSISLLAAAAAGNATGVPQTDYSVQIKFSYQYLSKKEYPAGETSVKIAIPVVQLDRFSVDEITQYTQYLQVGEEGSLTVPLMNKGKSLIYNISGVVKAPNPETYISPVEHAGNFEAGKTGEINLSITINVPGEFNGEAVISYEDENANQKEVSVPFTIMVMEPPPPQFDTPSMAGPDMEQPQQMGLLGIILCSVGSFMVASPIALYLIKRVKTKGIEDDDEDF